VRDGSCPSSKGYKGQIKFEKDFTAQGYIKSLRLDKIVRGNSIRSTRGPVGEDKAGANFGMFTTKKGERVEAGLGGMTKNL